MAVEMDAVLGQEEAVTFLRSRLTNPPHIILWGPTGVGKTMLANAWISEQLAAQGVSDLKDQAKMVLRLGSADDRGIAVIRQRVMDFVRQRRPVPGTQAWIVFDDADNLNGKDHVVVQQALRRIMELHAHQTRFCFIAQSPEHFIEPIQSRCVIVQLHPVPLHLYTDQLLSSATTSTTPAPFFTPDALSLMVRLCAGNVRQFVLMCRTLNCAAAAAAKSEITVEDVVFIGNAPPTATLSALQTAVFCDDISAITEQVLALWEQGFSFEDVISMLETTTRVLSPVLTEAHQKVLVRCAEGHICQILNQVTTLDLIAVLAGVVP